MEINKKEISLVLKKNKWNLTNFAQELGLSRCTVSRVMNNKRRPGGAFIGAFTRRFPDEPINKYFFA